MTSSKKFLWVLCAIAFTAPIIIFANSTGPPPRRTGAPGDATCVAADCHVGTLNPATGGHVMIEFTDGTTTYTPGATKRVRVMVIDAGGRIYGFQATARPLSNLENGQAGALRPSDNRTQVICEDDSRPVSGACRSTAPVQFIEHTLADTNSMFEFDWVAPSTDIGQIRFYVAGNAANGNGQPTGDLIHTAQLTVSRAAAGGPPPSINSGGVVNGASFQPGIVSGSWVSIFGSNFTTARRDWEGLIQNGIFPTEIEGVRVNINGHPAAIHFISPGQINVQVPDDTSTGIVNVEVMTPGGSTSATANLEQIRPGLFGFDTTTRRYVSATSGPNFIGNPAETPGTRPARPSEIIELWGTGFGPTQEPRPAGRIVTAPSPVTAQVRVRIGSVDVTPEFAGIVGAGLYQVNVRVPENLGNGAHQVAIIVGGVESANNGNLFVQRQ